MTTESFSAFSNVGQVIVSVKPILGTNIYLLEENNLPVVVHSRCHSSTSLIPDTWLLDLRF